MPIDSIKIQNTKEYIKDVVTPSVFVGTCSTAAATVEKEATVNTFPLDSNNKPIVGTLVSIKFAEANTATAPTLNVNSTGAYSIWYNTGEYASNSTPAGVAERYTHYYWDGTYWVYAGCGVDPATSNTIAYRIKMEKLTRPMTAKVYRYRILFSSPDNTHWVPSNTSTSTNATASRTVNQAKINPFGLIVYYAYTTAINAESSPGASYMYTRYNVTLGYSFNRTGAALTLTTKAPVYLKMAAQTDGTAIIDSTTPYVQALPSTDDGKLYLYLGDATSATTVEMMEHHPIYYYKDSQIRVWTNAAASSSITVDQTYNSSSTNPQSGTAVAGAIANKANSATTLSGYGITDAKIESGIITLGSNTITPLTSHQDISGKEDTSNKVTSISSASTDTQYPSAKCVYDAIQAGGGGGGSASVVDKVVVLSGQGTVVNKTLVL